MPDQTTTVPEGQPEGRDKPDWLLPKFGTVEDQARSYAAAEAEMSRAQARTRELEEYAAQLEQQQAEYEQALAAQPQPSQQPAFNPLQAQYEQALEQAQLGDTGPLLAMNAYIASQIADQKIAETLGKQQQTGPDPAQNEMYALWADNVARERYDNQYGQGSWDDVKRDAAEFLVANPDLLPEDISPIQAAGRLVMAAEYVQGRKMLTATEQERNQLDQARQRRLMAQTMTGSGATPPTQETEAEAWARIQNAPVGSYAELRSR